MRLLYLPNEPGDWVQVGPRKAFEKLHKEGVLSHYETYSFLKREAFWPSHQEALDELLELVRKFQPDVIFIQKIRQNNFALDMDYLHKLKKASNAKIVYNDLDPYGRKYIARFDATQKALMSVSDMVFFCALGYMAEQAKRAGAGAVRLMLHSYDEGRFGTDWEPTKTRKYDVAMISNLWTMRGVPGLYLPGGRKRKQVARLLHDAFDERFALFGTGNGWSGEPYCKGRIPFDQQEKYVRSAWLTIGFDNYNELPMYSSDRVPISIACGVPHITNWQPHYDHVYYTKVPGLYAVKTPQEAVDVAISLMSLPPSERNDLGTRAAKYAQENLEAYIVYKDALEVIKEQLLS